MSNEWQWTALPADYARVVVASGLLPLVTEVVALGGAHAGRCAARRAAPPGAHAARVAHCNPATPSLRVACLQIDVRADPPGGVFLTIVQPATAEYPPRS